MKIGKSLLRLLGLIVALTLIAAACGSDEESTSDDETGDADTAEEPAEDDTVDDETSDDEGTDDEATGDDSTDGETAAGGDIEQAELTAAVIPITDVVALHAGIREGTFADAGLTVTAENAAGGAAIVPGVIAGDFDIGFSNVYSVMAAAQAGLDIRIIAAGNFVGQEDFSGLLSLNATSIEELEGQTVAVNTLGNLVQITTQEAMEQAGLDPSTVNFTEIAFPEMVGAMEAGQVDAISTVEPFVGIAQGAGANLLATPFSASQPDLMVAVWFTTGEFADNNPNTVAAFVGALDANGERLQTDRDFANEIVAEFTATPDVDAAAGLTLPIWRSGIDVASLEASAALGQKWGLLDGAADLDALVN